MAEARATRTREAGAVVLTALATQQLLMAYDSTAMNVAISDIVGDLGTTLTGVQSAISLYALVMAALMLTGSKLGTRRGHTRVFLLGATVYGVGALVTAISPGLPVMLLGWSLLEGIGAALVFPAVLSITTLAFTGPARTRALSVIGAMTGIGAALGPILGGLITRYLTWRVSFLMETLVTAAVIMLMRRVAEPKADQPQTPFDALGVVLSALGLGLIVMGTLLAGSYGLITARKDFVVLGWTVTSAGGVSPTVLLIVLGVVVLAGFALWERRRVTLGKDPLVRLVVLRDRGARVGSLALGAQFLVTAGSMFLVPVFLQTTLGYDALRSGVALLPSTLTLILAAVVASRLVAAGRVQRKPLIFAGFVLMAVGALLIAVLFGPDSSGGQLAPGLAVLGLGLGLCAILPDLVQSSAARDQVSDVAGLSRSFSYLGQSLGVALAGAVMVGVLLSTFTDDIQRSALLDDAQKAAVASIPQEGVQVTAVSDDDLRGALQARGVGGPVTEELVRVNARAREAGITAAMLAMAACGLIGAAVALRLPRTAGLPSDAGSG